jgi:Amt family ammonium transporter
MTAFAANFVSETGLVWVNTCVATCAAILGWLLLEKLRDGKPTSVGAASGAVAGLVAITPACGSLSPVGSIILGVVVGIACAWAVGLKYKLGFDDSLDVVGVHLVGGIVGTLGVGFLATNGGLLYGDGAKQLVVQASIALFAIVWSGGWTAVIGLALKAVMGWRISEEDEVEGIDVAEHAESAYDFVGVGGASRSLAGVGAVSTSAASRKESVDA